MKATSSSVPIAITGMGVVTPIGDNTTTFKASLCAGRSGITQWKHLIDDCYSQIGGDMSDFDLKHHLSTVGAFYPESLASRARKLLRSTPLAGRLTAAAALQAYVDAGLNNAHVSPEKIGHILAGHNLNAAYIYENDLVYQQEPAHIDGLYGIFALDSDILAVISELLTLKGVCFTVGGACASGNLALLTALNLLRSGQISAVVVSGGAVSLNPVILQGWAMLQALSIKSFNGTPEEASRPFDARREGFVPSEGSAAVVLETVESAQSRGATIHAYLLGAASNSNASRLTRPDHDAQVRAMQDALANADIRPEQINYINAHATSTPAGDAVEVAAIKTLLGNHAYHVPINATKSMLGHCLTSTAIIELVAVVLQMNGNFVHPTINLTNPDLELDLDFVCNTARAHHIEYALSNAFGFGGLNACVVVGRATKN